MKQPVKITRKQKAPVAERLMAKRAGWFSEEMTENELMESSIKWHKMINRYQALVAGLISRHYEATGVLLSYSPKERR